MTEAVYLILITQVEALHLAGKVGLHPLQRKAFPGFDGLVFPSKRVFLGNSKCPTRSEMPMHRGWRLSGFDRAWKMTHELKLKTPMFPPQRRLMGGHSLRLRYPLALRGDWHHRGCPTNGTLKLDWAPASTPLRLGQSLSQ